ncbi:MAG: hypothetical protein ACO2XQ_06315 [Flavobacteriales bacterium]
MLSIFVFLGCQLNDVTEPADVLELEGPRVDSLVQDPWYDSRCHFEMEKSVVPVLREIPGASRWNDLIQEEFYEATLESHCRFFNWSEEELEKPKAERLEYGISDTLAYKRLGFEIRDFTHSTLCLQTEILTVPHGANGWTLDYRIFNIDVITGEEIPIPDALYKANVRAADWHIRDFFGDNGDGTFYHCHSCEYPDYIAQLIENHQVGLINGEWIGFEMIWPTTHGHNSKQIVEMPLGRFEVEYWKG